MKQNHPSALRTILARNLRVLRAEQGLTQDEVAEAAGIHRGYLSDVERAVRNVSLDNISRLAVALDVPAARLLEE